MDRFTPEMLVLGLGLGLEGFVFVNISDLHCCYTLLSPISSAELQISDSQCCHVL